MSYDFEPDTQVRLSNVGKSFRIYDKPSARLRQMLPFKSENYFRDHWAVRGVNLTIRRRETVGIIGANGSGKSTLLQMICNTLSPSEGDVRVSGRIAALLELGAGFNSEFTGVENVYLVGSLYGLTRAEIEQRFESIKNFADIGEHLTQPVKTYSSGMYVRLAFAIIAHVDADILVIDEALAVGDAIFTQKCMRFIRNFRSHGTLIFVSHDMGSVLNLCNRAVWLDKGQVRMVDSAKSVCDAYLHFANQEISGLDLTLNESVHDAKDDAGSGLNEADSLESANYSCEMFITNNLTDANGWRTGHGEITSISLSVAGRSDFSDEPLRGGELVTLKITATAHEKFDSPILGFLVRDRLGQDLFGENTLKFTNSNKISLKSGEKITAKFSFRLPFLPNGTYSLMASFADGDLFENIQHHWMHDAILLRVASSDVRYGLMAISFNEVDLCK